MKPDRPGATTESLPVSTERRKRWVLPIGICVVLLILAVPGRRMFSRWQHGRLIRSASESFHRGDFVSASLSAREACLKDPGSLAACAILAEIAAQRQSPEAILWRQRLVELEPANSARLLDLASTASALGETFVAAQALEKIPADRRDTVAFHTAAGSIAVAAKQFPRAGAEFQRAAELDPKNDSIRLNLATIRLALGPPGSAAEAVATLERLRENPGHRSAALRALLADARRRGDSARAMGLATELRQGAQATLADMLLWLEELQRSKSPEFDEQLRGLQAAAEKSEGTIYSIMSWMNARGFAAQTIAWGGALPVSARSRMPVPIAQAEACLLVADWKRARTLVADGDWGDVEFLRFAFHARVLEGTGGRSRRAEFGAMWERAVNTTRGNVNALSMLARLVTGWGWKDEAAQIWWMIARNGTGQRPALEALYAMHAAARNTRELYRVARRILEIEPANPAAKNNVASLALLLGEDLSEAHRLAAENFAADANQRAFAATYALSLHREQRSAEAAVILGKLPAAAFDDPSAAATYGVILRATGEDAKAAAYLETAMRGKDRLFPEELAMVGAVTERQP